MFKLRYTKYMARNRNYQIDKRWEVRKPGKVFISDKFTEEFIRLLAARGIHSEEEAEKFINPKYEDLSNPILIPDVELAVKTIVSSIKNNEKIAIYGDYDVDGVTATALLVDFFRNIGIETVPYIPSRSDEGYGLNVEAIETLAKQAVKLIITVDCGSTSIVEVARANELGVKVIVIDHHVLKLENKEIVLPTAVAVINPKRMSPDSPLYELAGVAVAFYLVRALMVEYEEKYAKGQEKWLLDLVALGTICDVVPLNDENRILAKWGLKVLAKSRRKGIIALAKTAEINLEVVDSYKVGFLLGPRLNAAGRMEHAQLALNLLLTDDQDEAQRLAEELNELNRIRQELTERIIAEAKEYIEKDGASQKIYLLAKADWPAGVVGIVASRLAEEYGRPMLIMEDSGTELKGSARSIRNFNIIDALVECGDLLCQCGGHAFAAGFKLNKDKFILLNDKLIQISNDKIQEKDLMPEICIDMEILNKKIVQKFLNELIHLEPYGRENNKPLFLIKSAKIIEARLVGTPAIHLKLVVEQDRQSLAGIAFGYGETLDLNIGEVYDLVVTLEINEWNNHKSPEFRLMDLKHADTNIN
jgi:single-stranded-DNA-specific exonuclease